MTMRAMMLALCCWILPVQMASSATVMLLSTGAVEPGIRIAAERFQRASGHEIRMTFQTAPEVKRRLESREVWDLAIAPPSTIDEQTRSGWLARGAVTLGRVGVGIAVRQGAPLPDIATTDSLKRAILEADTLIASRGSTGQYAESLIRKLGLFEQVEARLVRTDRGAEAMQRLASGKGRELAFGALTEIASARNEGVVLVGRLPLELQNYTTYVIAQLTQAPNTAAAAEFLRYLGTPASQADFRAQGIEE